MTDKDIHIICEEYDIENYTIRDGLVDVDEGVDLYGNGFNELPLNFGRVSGSFNCSNNNLTSLKGAPNKVGGYFDCVHNNLVSLKGSPLEIGGSFSCAYNKLASLKESPKKVKGYFNCIYNKLNNLNGAPLEVGSKFHCSDNNKELSYESYLLKVKRINKLEAIND